MRESKIEFYLRCEVEKRGGVCEKFVSPGRRFVPDRLCSWPGGVVHFIECKRPDQKPTEGQLRDHDRRRVMGFDVYLIDSYADVDDYISICQDNELCK